MGYRSCRSLPSCEAYRLDKEGKRKGGSSAWAWVVDCLFMAQRERDRESWFYAFGYWLTSGHQLWMVFLVHLSGFMHRVGPQEKVLESAAGWCFCEKCTGGLGGSDVIFLH